MVTLITLGLLLRPFTSALYHVTLSISLCCHSNHTYVAVSTGNLQLLSIMVSMAITLLKN